MSAMASDTCAPMASLQMTLCRCMLQASVQLRLACMLSAPENTSTVDTRYCMLTCLGHSCSHNLITRQLNDTLTLIVQGR